MMQAVKNGWTRAIGVDDYKPAQIENLKGTKPAVNMCSCARPLSLSLIIMMAAAAALSDTRVRQPDQKRLRVSRRPRHRVISRFSSADGPDSFSDS